MTVTLTYKGIWEWLVANWSEIINYYWNDFNPTNPTLPTPLTSLTVSNPTSSFDLYNFQPWHEVWCWVFNLTNSWSSSVSFTLYWEFQRLKNWTWSKSWQYKFTGTIQANWLYWGWMYFGIDDDEIWEWYTDYRIYRRWAAWTDIIQSYSNFTVYDLNIDSNLYPSWCLWVDWARLCYTDGTHFYQWYKHEIKNDYSVYEYVGRESAGCIWMENSWATAMKHIYFVTENGYKTRTYWYQERYGGNVNVWSGNRWSLRVPTWDMEYWYWHLCYVTATWQKLRVLNWPPF